MQLYNSAHRIGHRPGVLREQDSQARILWTRYGADHLEQGELHDFAALPAVSADNCLWLDIVGVPGQAGLVALEKAYGLHRLALEDVQNQGQMPKYEDFDTHIFCVLQLPLDLPQDSLECQLSLFLAPNLVVSIHRCNTVFDPIRERLQTNRGIMRRAGAEYLLYAITDLAVDLGLPLLDRLSNELLDLEDQADTSHRDLSRDIYALRRPLSSLLRKAQRQRDAVASLLERNRMEQDGGCELYWRDCLDHAERYMEQISHLRENAGDLLNTHLALVSHRMNDVIKVLTMMSSLFIPLSFVVGLYGMNFDTDSPHNMPELGWRFGYLYVWGVMSVIVVGLLLFFRKKRWI